MNLVRNDKQIKLILTNHENLILIDTQRNTHQLIKEPLGNKQEFVSVSASRGLKGYSDPNQTFILLFCSDYTMALINSDGSQRARFGGFKAGISGNPGGFTDFPTRISLTPEGTILVLVDNELIELDTYGARRFQCPNVKDFYIDHKGFRWVVGDVQLPNDPFWKTLDFPPRVEDESSQSLAGIDHSGNVYWVNSGAQTRIREVFKTDSRGKITARCLLNGTDGVIPELRMERQQISSICSHSNGSLYVFGFDFQEHSKVAIYEVNMKD
jgi:hypothetical protein